MRAAVLQEFDATPLCEAFPDPEPADGHVVVDVAAAAIHHLDLHKATGTFYMGPPPLPSVVGTDGVGTVGDRRVFFDVTIPPFGTMAERCLVPDDVLIDYDADLSDALAAACGNSGIGAW